jgi:hypothetical protein
MKSSLFRNITPLSMVKGRFQRTTRRYIPEDETLHIY